MKQIAQLIQIICLKVGLLKTTALDLVDGLAVVLVVEDLDDLDGSGLSDGGSKTAISNQECRIIFPVSGSISVVLFG